MSENINPAMPSVSTNRALENSANPDQTANMAPSQGLHYCLFRKIFLYEMKVIKMNLDTP